MLGPPPYPPTLSRKQTGIAGHPKAAVALQVRGMAADEGRREGSRVFHGETNTNCLLGWTELPQAKMTPGKLLGVGQNFRATELQERNKS